MSTLNKVRYTLRLFLAIAIVLITFNQINAQVVLESYIDVGENNVSEGVFIKNLYRSNYQYRMYTIETGVQFDLHSNNPNTLTGFDFIGSREFTVKDFPFDVKGFFILNRFSDLLHETNWGFRVETKKLEYFLFELGMSNRAYTINKEARDEYKINKSSRRLSENLNLLYVITAYLKPHNNEWNVGLSCTNVDYYVINQSTNPVFNLQMTYKLKPKQTLHFGAWYKQAGIFNINANYFGYFFRGGITWEI